MQRFEVSGAVRPIYGSLGVKRLTWLFLLPLGLPVVPFASSSPPTKTFYAFFLPHIRVPLYTLIFPLVLTPPPYPPGDITWRHKIMKPLITKFSPVFCYVLSVRHNTTLIIIVTIFIVIIYLSWNHHHHHHHHHICHGVGPLVDPFRSHVSRSLFKGLPWFLLPVGQ